MTIVEFLTACYDEAEQEWLDNRTLFGFWDDRPSSPLSLKFMLADIAAKRRVIQVHHGSGVTCPVCSLGAEADGVVYELEPCGTLQLLALPFADRPGYDETWRPA